MRCWQVDGCGGKVVLVPLWDPAGSYVEAVSLQLRGEDGDLTTVELSYEAIGELMDDLYSARGDMSRPVASDRKPIKIPGDITEASFANDVLDDEIPF